MSTAVVAEKPSVARDIARVLGARKRGAGYLHGEGYVVTWAIGHLVTLAEPQQMDPAWRRWRPEALPMLPREWPLVVPEQTREQFEVVRRILTSPRIERVVCATDAGREGELIFRYIYQAAGCRKPVQRLWISSLTPKAIRDGFAALRDGADYDALADAARGRSQADWLVGMNLSRAYSLARDERLSVGRVQTPTLAMVVERELAIRDFVPEDYQEVQARFAAAGGEYPGTWFRGEKPDAEARRLPADGEEAAAIAARVRGGAGRVAQVQASARRLPPPLLYDLTELQRHANRLYGLSAERTLAAAQALYETHKLISYPRTDSRHLSSDVAATLGAVVAAVAEPYRERLAPGTGERPIPPRFVDDAKVTDHHAIVPTPTRAQGKRLGREEERVYDLVCRRLLAAWHADHLWSVTNVLTEVRSDDGSGGEQVDRFHSSGTAVQQEGWKVLDPKPQGRKGSEPEPTLPGGLEADLPARVLDVQALAKQTRPPRRFTDATLLTAMETAGRSLDDKALSEAMKETGLGTPATRAAIMETLLTRGFLERDGKSLLATDKGIRLVQAVHPTVKSPAMTGEWEARLRRVQRGEEDLAGFMAAIEAYVREAVGAALSAGPGEAEEGRTAADLGQHRGGAASPLPERAQRRPTPPDGLDDLLHGAFGFAGFRPHQEAVCRAVTAGRDALLVMPTGAGKSLCYQLPGLARAGTTLVISPLIALMEDQVAKLRALGLAAERIHSGRDRAASRQTCRDYLDGRLDFLFIAPERLAVPGFPELLARRPPALVAVDEAHCISHWGHDFRPDYRLLGERLPQLRPAPVIALTATATPRVQEDIADQLHLDAAQRFIHGFRRDNLAVEVAELPRPQRPEAVARVLADPARRPAIVYAPSRRDTEELAARLARDFPAAAYHAGMEAARRERVQQAFLAGELSAIVATIAFGMGVDKPDVRTIVHTGLPGSLEGYYQEIGRAGRDGRPARAILLHSYADLRLHEHFHARNYPDPEVLQGVYEALGEAPRERAELAAAVSLDEAALEQALDRLRVHAGVRVEADGRLVRGEAGWRQAYRAQRDHHLAQLDAVSRFAEAAQCRMLRLVQHFGDREDHGRPCGLCDVCAPRDCLVAAFQPPDATQRGLAEGALAALRRRDGQTVGQLHKAVGEPGPQGRRGLQRVLEALARAGWVVMEDDAFDKDGETIRFQRVHLAERAPARTEELADLPVPSPPSPAPRAAGGKPRQRARSAPPDTAPADPSLVQALKAWRLEESRRRGLRAFQVFGDRTLLAIAAARPSDREALLSVPGMGPTLLERYGQQVLDVIRNTPTVMSGA